MIHLEHGVIYQFYVTSWLDRDQVRVLEVGNKMYAIKSGRQLSEDEIRGAIVRYEINKRKLLNGRNTRLS